MEPIRKILQEIEDDEIRVVGTQSPIDKGCLPVLNENLKIAPTQSKQRRKGKWWIISIEVVLFLSIGVLIGYLCSRPKAVNTRSSISLFANVNENLLYSYSEIEYIDTENMRLLSVTPINSKPDLVIGHSCLDDTTATCIVQAASIAIDKDGKSSIVGAMVIDGAPLSWGKSKAGYCAIFNDSIYIGASKHSSLFEESTVEGGDFFRQYSLVENGQLSSMKNMDKHIRRALCVRNDLIQIISSVDKVVLNDFTRALIECGVTEALMLEGGDAILKYSDKNFKETCFGKIDYPESDCVSYLVWK